MNANNIIKLKDHQGFKRLAIFLVVIVFIISFVSISIIFGRDLPRDLIKGISVLVIFSSLITLIFYIVLRTIFWIIDGFRIEKHEK